MTVHPLAEARAEQEASELNSQLGQVVYNAIIDRLKVAGRCHADDLEPYFPPEHRLRCRKLIGGQFGSLSGRKYIEPVEYLKSTVPARKGGKSWAYRFTALGKAKLAGMGGMGNEGPAPSDPGESITEDRGQARKAHALATPEPADAVPGDASPDSAPGDSPQSLGALPEPLSLFDQLNQQEAA
jgi:hypothetical protein